MPAEYTASLSTINSRAVLSQYDSLEFSAEASHCISADKATPINNVGVTI